MIQDKKSKDFKHKDTESIIDLDNNICILNLVQILWMNCTIK
jgi:hypothetical protein